MCKGKENDEGRSARSREHTQVNSQQHILPGSSVPNGNANAEWLFRDPAAASKIEGVVQIMERLRVPVDGVSEGVLPSCCRQRRAKAAGANFASLGRENDAGPFLLITLQGFHVIGAFEGSGVRARLLTQTPLHQSHRVIFMLLHPADEISFQVPNLSYAVFQ